MSRKVQHHVQPREEALPRNIQVREEIQNFLLALDSYPARAVQEPRVNFQQHLCSFFAAACNDRQSGRARRHGAA